MLPGIIGLLQTNEIIKLLLGKGETLAGRLVLLDALGNAFHSVQLRPNPRCPACGDGAQPEALLGAQAEEACALRAGS